MSLETSPSVRSEWKLRLEIFLSTCWRIYSSVERYFYRRRKWGSSDSNLTKLTAQAAEAYLRYRGTLEIKHLEKAIEKFWQAKHRQNPIVNQGENLYCLYLEGYADKTAKRNMIDSIRATLYGQDAKLTVVGRSFRPDVAYRVPGNFGLCSGLTLQMTSADLGLIRRVAKMMSQLKESASISIERFHVTDCTTDDVQSMVMRNLGELLPLIEAMCEHDFAENLCSEMLRIDVAPELHCTSRELVKLFMLARTPFPDVLNSEGWATFSIRLPDWRALRDSKRTMCERRLEFPDSREPRMTDSIPTPSMAVILDALVFYGDVLIAGNEMVSVDPAANPAFSFVAGHQDVVVGTPSVLGTAAVRMPQNHPRFIPEGILLSSRADQNWFHWLIETLPKLVCLDAGVPSGVPIIISDHIPKSAKESITYLSKRRVVEIPPIEGTRVGKLYVASPILFHPDPIELYLSPLTNVVNMEVLAQVRSEFLSKVAQGGSRSSLSKSIYVGRTGGGRSLLNSRGVEVVLRELGFEVIQPEQMSVIEQVLAFNSAKRIMLVGGASMANLIFCNTGTEIWTMNSPLTENYMMPKILASLSFSTATPIVGRAVGNLLRHSKTEKLHAHISVSKRRIKASLTRNWGG